MALYLEVQFLHRGRISYDKPGKDEVVTLRLHPMDGRVLDFDVTAHGNSIASGKEPKQLLRTLQDKGGSGKFRRVSYDPDRKAAFMPDPSPFKKINASGTNGNLDLEEKTFVCEDAQKKFFSEYLWSSVQKISEAVISKSKNNFYKEAAVQLLEFLESEKIFFDNLKH